MASWDEEAVDSENRAFNQEKMSAHYLDLLKILEKGLNELEKRQSKMMISFIKDDAVLVSRQELDAHYMTRLKSMETGLEDLEKRINSDLVSIKNDILSFTQMHEKILADITERIEKIIHLQNEYNPAMESLKSVISAGLAMRWILIVVVGILASIGTVLTTWDSVKKWLVN